MEEKREFNQAGSMTMGAAREEVEIDLLEVIRAIWKRLWLVILCGIVGAVLALGITQVFITPTYTSTSKMLVLSKDTTISSLADLQIGSQLTNDYTILIQSRTALEKTIQNLGLNMSTRALKSHISINNPTSSRILEISVTDPSPEQASRIVNELSRVSSEFIGESMEVTNPRIIEDGVVPTERSGPSRFRNAAVGGLLGVVLAIAIIVILLLLNDAIVTEEDVNKYLGLPVLSLLPMKEGEKKKKTPVKGRINKLLKGKIRHGR